MENGKCSEGQKIGKLWYVSKENLEKFLEGGRQEGEEISKSRS